MSATAPRPPPSIETVRGPVCVAYAGLAIALIVVWEATRLALVALAAGLSLGYVAGAIPWGFHVAFDRAIGLRLRSPDGFQRPGRDPTSSPDVDPTEETEQVQRWSALRTPHAQVGV